MSIGRVEPESAADADLLTVDELAQISGVPTRTIRFYRQTGLLPAPRRVGRRAFYDRDQVERLRIVGELRERGLGLESIAKILDEPEGEHASAIIGITDELRRPWTEDEAAVMTRSEVVAALGIEREHSLENLVRYGVISPIDIDADADADSGAAAHEERYQVPSVRTLHLAGDLKFAGLRPEFMFEAWQAMQRHLGALAQELVVLYTDEYHSGGDTWDHMAEAFPLARRVALRAVDQLFAQAMQKALADFVESGITEP